MTKIANVTEINIDNDDLICPITLELFQDPVRAQDGHVYERQAITQWIQEHGTSPLTRQPLQLDQLVPDEHIKRLAKQRRNSIVSYNVENNHVTLPLRRTVKSIPNRIRTNNCLKACLPQQTRGTIIGVLILLGIVLGFVFGIYRTFSNSIKTTTTKPPGIRICNTSIV